MKKALSLIIALTLILSAMLGITSGAAETEESGKLVISQANLQFGSTVYLLIAVDYSAVYSDIETAKEKVTVTVDGSELTADEEVMAIENFPANCVGFKYTKLGAKNMGDELEIKAFADGEEHSSTVYSVLEYTIQAKHLYSDNALLMDVIDKLLVFGAAAQTAFDYTDYDYPLADENGVIDYGIVIVEGATERKVIKAADTEYIPATEKADPLLFDMSYDAIENNTIQVQKGVQKAFYISSADQTICRFNAKTDDLERTVVYDNDGAAVKPGSQALKTGTGVPFTVTLNEVAEGQFAKAEYTTLNGERVLSIVADKGYGMSLSDGAENNLLNQIGDSRYFTVSITAASNGENTFMSAFRFRSKTGTQVNPNVMSVSASEMTELISSKSIVALEKGVLTTIHIVFDRMEKTVSYYCGGTLACEESFAGTGIDTFMTCEASRKYIHVFGGTTTRKGYIQKLIVTKGNIFE